MYNFITGPLAGFSFLVFLVGLLIRSLVYIRGLDTSLDRVSYGVDTTSGVKEAFRSIFYWLLPFGTRGWRLHPGMTALFFIFHFGLLLSAVGSQAHNILLKERWGISFFSLPDRIVDLLTLLVLATAVGLIFRRLLMPQVRILTKPSDYLLMIITIAPFLSGFLAYHQVSSYPFWMITHILSGELLLMAVPFTRLSHCFLFFFTRAQLGMDFGIKRGGLKRARMAW